MSNGKETFYKWGDLLERHGSHSPVVLRQRSPNLFALHVRHDFYGLAFKVSSINTTK